MESQKVAYSKNKKKNAIDINITQMMVVVAPRSGFYNDWFHLTPFVIFWLCSLQLFCILCVCKEAYSTNLQRTKSYPARFHNYVVSSHLLI